MKIVHFLLVSFSLHIYGIKENIANISANDFAGANNPTATIDQEKQDEVMINNGPFRLQTLPNDPIARWSTLCTNNDSLEPWAEFVSVYY